jgi:uncharacterized protein YraI
MRHILIAGLVAAGLVLTAAPAFALPAVTMAEAGFSAGPGTDYGPAPSLNIGTNVDVIWCGTHQNWCLVDIHNKRGWVLMASLNFKLPKVAGFGDDGTQGSGGDIGPAAGSGGQSPASRSMSLSAEPHRPTFTSGAIQKIKLP